MDGERDKDDGVLENPSRWVSKRPKPSVMTARIQLGWVDPADLGTEDEAQAEGEDGEAVTEATEEAGA